jgi:hypothetical protein
MLVALWVAGLLWGLVALFVLYVSLPGKSDGQWYHWIDPITPQEASVKTWSAVKMALVPAAVACVHFLALALHRSTAWGHRIAMLLGGLHCVFGLFLMGFALQNPSDATVRYALTALLLGLLTLVGARRPQAASTTPLQVNGQTG